MTITNIVVAIIIAALIIKFWYVALGLVVGYLILCIVFAIGRWLHKHDLLLLTLFGGGFLIISAAYGGA